MPLSGGTRLDTYETLAPVSRCVGVLLILTIPWMTDRATAGEAPAGDKTASSSSDSTRWSSFLPLMKEEAEKRGIELPLPFGVGLVYYHLERDIEITEVRVGRNGAPPISVSDYAQLASRVDVDNLN